MVGWLHATETSKGVGTDGCALEAGPRLLRLRPAGCASKTLVHTWNLLELGARAPFRARGTLWMQTTRDLSYTIMGRVAWWVARSRRALVPGLHPLHRAAGQRSSLLPLHAPLARLHLTMVLRRTEMHTKAHAAVSCAVVMSG